MFNAGAKRSKLNEQAQMCACARAHMTDDYHVVTRSRFSCLHAPCAICASALSDSRRHKYANTKIHSFRRTRARLCVACVCPRVCLYIIVFAVERARASSREHLCASAMPSLSSSSVDLSCSFRIRTAAGDRKFIGLIYVCATTTNAMLTMQCVCNLNCSH